MADRFEKSVFEYAGTIKPGELVLVEYTSREPVHLLLHKVLEYARLNGIAFVIVDVLDGLHVMRTHLMLAGVDASPIDSAPVIKIHGNVQTGTIIAKINGLAEFSILKRRFTEALKMAKEVMGGKPFSRIIVGATEFLQQLETEPMRGEEFLAGIIRPMVGNPHTMGLVLINRKRIGRATLGELEEMATRVLAVDVRDDKLIIRVTKSVHFGEYGMEVEFDSQTIGESYTK